MKKSLTAILPLSSLVSFKSKEARTALKAALSAMPGMPDMDLENYLTVQDGDFIHVPFRALSACPVQGGIIDFGHRGGQALKAAVGLFNGLTIFKDHDHTVDGWCGLTSGGYWDETTPGVPHGVNFMLDVDVKADPKVARGLLSGALNSGSVTIKFDFEQSHPDMEEDDFFYKLGETVDGQVVRALVTEVIRCWEYSVVWQGADSFAKVIGDDGKIIVPGQATNSLSFQQRQEKKKMDLKALAALLGLDLGTTVTEEALTVAVKAQNINAKALADANNAKTLAETTLTTAQAEVVTLKTQVAELTTSVTKATTDLATSQTQATALQTKVTELTPQAADGVKLITDTRSEALRLYNLVEGDKATEAMRTLINNSTLEVAKSFCASYKDRADQVAPMKCNTCGGTSLSRATAKQPVDMPGLGGNGISSLETERLKVALASVHGK